MALYILGPDLNEFIMTKSSNYWLNNFNVYKKFNMKNKPSQITLDFIQDIQTRGTLTVEFL
jgi:hypothetical protein